MTTLPPDDATAYPPPRPPRRPTSYQITVHGTLTAKAQLHIGHWHTLNPGAVRLAENTVSDQTARLVTGPVFAALHEMLGTPGIGTGNPAIVHSALIRLDRALHDWHDSLAAQVTITRTEQ